MASVEIREEPLSALEAYGQVPIAFRVDRVLEPRLVDRGLGGIVLTERPVDPAYIKDYDAIEGEGPARWAARFDTAHWGLHSAWIAGRRVGGAVTAFDTPGLDMLEGRTDLAVLWDLRVEPAARGQGIGSALFGAVEAWAAARRCRALKVETQHINAAACRFYAAMGCTLGVIHRFAYPELPEEVQLVWYKAL